MKSSLERRLVGMVGFRRGNAEGAEGAEVSRGIRVRPGFISLTTHNHFFVGADALWRSDPSADLCVLCVLCVQSHYNRQ